MKIGIDASRAFLKRRTGIEEYSYQVIKHLRSELSHEEVILYMRPEQSPDFVLPKTWRIRRLWAPRLWTQGRLSFEMLFHSPDILFVPAHTVPFIHPRRTYVTIHGLEYEFCPESYSWYERFYMRLSIRFSCRVAETVICVSENTKCDVMRLYGVPEEKICVVYEGYAQKIQNPKSKIQYQDTSYILFIGRIETRKNVARLIEAFAILKERYRIPHRLVLVGKPGYGYADIKSKIQNLTSIIPIEEVGYVSEEEKQVWLAGTSVFVFPSLYEGFGLPILEAQAVGVPVVISSTSSLPEIGGEGAVYIDPLSVESIVEGIYSVLSDAALRDGIIEKAAHNVNRFGWAQCARELSSVFVLAAKLGDDIVEPLSDKAVNKSR